MQLYLRNYLHTISLCYESKDIRVMSEVKQSPEGHWEERCTVAGMFYGHVLCSNTEAWKSPNPHPHPRRGDFIQQHVQRQGMCIQMKE